MIGALDGGVGRSMWRSSEVQAMVGWRPYQGGTAVAHELVSSAGSDPCR